MTTNTTQKAAGAINTNGLHTDTNNADFRTCEATGQAPDGKAIATQLTHLALDCLAVCQTADRGFLVSKCSYTHHAKDFARKLGVKQ
jgi:hypothetical protein